MKNAIDPQKNFKKWLEANKEKVAEFIKQNDVSVRDLDFDYRITNILESNGLYFLSDILWKTAVELRKLDFIRRDESERIVLATRYYLRNHMEELVAFCQKENLETSASSNELVSKAEAEFSCQKEDSDSPVLNDDFESAAETESEKVAFEFAEVKSVFDIVSEKFDREITDEILELPIDVLTFSNHTFNFLQNRGIHTIGDLLKSHKHRFSHVKYFRNNIEELVAFSQKENAILSTLNSERELATESFCQTEGSESPASSDDPELKVEGESFCQTEGSESSALNDDLEPAEETESETGSIEPVEIDFDSGSKKAAFPLPKERLKLAIDVLELSKRSYNALRRAGFHTIGDLLKSYERGFSHINNFGKQSVKEVYQKIDAFIMGNCVVQTSEKNETEKKGLPFDENENDAENEEICEEIAQEIPNQPLDILGLSVRSYNALGKNGIQTIGEALEAKKSDRGLSSIRNLGVKSIEEIEETLDLFLLKNIVKLKDESRTTENNTLDLLPKSEYPLTFDEIMESATMKECCIAFFQEYAVCCALAFDQMFLSIRAKNALCDQNIHQISELIQLYPDGILSIRNIGKKTLHELCIVVKEAVEANIKQISYYIQQTDEWMKEKILQLIQSDGFHGYSFEQIKKAVPAVSDEDRIKKAVGALLEKGLIEYVDFRCYPVYPSFSEVLKLAAGGLTERESDILTCRLIDGKTLEEIGVEFSITRERVRQIFLKANKKVKLAFSRKNGIHFDEEYYKYLFTHYSAEKEFWTDFLKLPQSTLSYLKNFCTSGEQSLEEAENDPNLDLNLKIKIQNYLDRGKLKINGEMINGERAALEDYAIKLLCRDEMIWDDFCAAYNKMLSDNKIPFDEKLYITNENSTTRKNRIREAKQCLWKYGQKLRYYDMEAQDYSELLEGIGFPQYDNTAISTLKWFQEYPELMVKYDIRDHYELHNLLKKTIDPKTYPEVSFDHQPGITFGSFDKEKVIYEIIKIFSPISMEELYEYLYDEYGFERGAVLNWLQPFAKYYHNGIYKMDFKPIPEDRVAGLKEALTEEFYFISEIEKIYGELFSATDLEEINPHSLKALGLTVLSNYVLTKHEIAESFFEDILTREDVYSIAPFQKRFGTIQMYNQTYHRMRENCDIFLFENDQIVTMNRLQKADVTKESILEFCESVYDFVDEGEMFTIFSLRKAGFTSKLDDLGFDDSFYNGILAMNASFIYQKVFHGIVLMKGNSGMLSKKQFILSELSHYDVVDVDEFVDDVEAEYGILIPERNEITRTLESTDFYYDETMNRIYKNKDLYYEDLEDEA